MNEKFKIEGKIWNMKKGRITAVMIADKIFSLVDNIEDDINIFNVPVAPTKQKKSDMMDKTIDKPTKKHVQKARKRGVKVPYLIKWIKQKNLKAFSLDQFFREFPKIKQNNKAFQMKLIAKLIEDKQLLQVSSDKFIVSGEFTDYIVH